MLKELIKLSNELDKKGLHKEADYLDSIIKSSGYQDRLLEERNFMMDSRTNAENAWEGFDERSNTIAISWTRYDEEYDTEEEQELKLPAKLELCDMCSGKGKVVNPSIDAGGISRDDFDEDPEFEEDYFSGRHDIPCPQCGGKRVIPVIDYENLSAEQKKEFDEYQHEKAEEAADAESDRRTQMAEMGLGW